MPSIITLDGARRAPSLLGRLAGLADEWSTDATATSGGSSALGDATGAFLLWGAVAFAGATAAIRGWRAMKHGFGFEGASRRRRRR